MVIHKIALGRKRIPDVFLVKQADFSQSALVAFRISRGANISPMKNKPVMGLMSKFSRNKADKLLFGG